MRAWFLFFVTITFGSVSTNSVHQDKPRHILFILPDDIGTAVYPSQYQTIVINCAHPLVRHDTGFNDVGYHNDAMHTPTIDRLAQQGIRLESYYTQSMCSPARAAIMTGRYPVRYGMQSYVLVHPQPWGLPLGEVKLRCVVEF